MASEKPLRPTMETIPPQTLLSLPTRIAYSSSFLHFSPTSDGAAINASAPLIAPLIPTVLDLIYTNLLTFDITAKAFVPKKPNETSAPTKPQDLNLSHEHILRQKNFLQGYLLRIARNEDWSPQSKLWDYMNKVGIAHTGAAGFAHRSTRPELRVEYMHLGLLLGYVEEVVVGAVMGMEEVDLGTKGAVIRAWNKVLWMQNDLFARHYTVDRDTGETPVAVGRSEGMGLGDRKVWAVGLLGVLVGTAATMGLGLC